jgi:uncharacterized protein
MNSRADIPIVPSPSCMWKVLDGTGLERFQLLPLGEGWNLRGTLIRLHQGQPFEVKYSIACDSRWQTLNANIELWGNQKNSSIFVENREGAWTANGQRVSQLDGCLDMDLEWSPSTNTLPIRRLKLAEHRESGLIDAAWIRFPELALDRLEQRYTLLADRCYRYSSGQGQFTAEIVVDERGIVEEYKGYWKQV